MLEYNIKMKNGYVFDREKAAVFTRILARYDSSVMLCDQSRTVNAKSLLGVLFFGIATKDILHFTIDGKDEADVCAAIEAFFIDSASDDQQCCS